MHWNSWSQWIIFLISHQSHNNFPLSAITLKSSEQFPTSRPCKYNRFGHVQNGPTLGGKKSDFSVSNITPFWQFRKVDISSKRKSLKKIWLHRQFNHNITKINPFLLKLCGVKISCDKWNCGRLVLSSYLCTSSLWLRTNWLKIKSLKCRKLVHCKVSF